MSECPVRKRHPSYPLDDTARQTLESRRDYPCTLRRKVLSNGLTKLCPVRMIRDVAAKRKTASRPAGPPVPDRLIHETMRLRIVSALAANESLSFHDLKKLLGATDGNLSVHMRKLEDAQYVTCAKSFAGRIPRTQYRLTPAGRRAFERYLTQMESLIRAARGGGDGASGSPPASSRSGRGA